MEKGWSLANKLKFNRNFLYITGLKIKCDLKLTMDIRNIRGGDHFSVLRINTLMDCKYFPIISFKILIYLSLLKVYYFNNLDDKVNIF